MNPATCLPFPTGRLRVLLLAALFVTSGARSIVSAQQDPLFSQYMFNTLAFNPAYAGSGDVLTVMALSRHQWVGFDGAPSTQTLVGHGPLKLKGLSLGASIVNDKAGPVKQTGAYIDIAYRIRTGAKSRLAFGLKGGGNLFQAELANLTTVESDPSNQNLGGQFLPNFGFGIYWHSPKAYLGISSPKLLTNTLNTAAGSVLTTAREARHYFLVAGVVLDMGTELKFKPSVMVRAVEGAPLSLDINANFLLRERVWFGAMYRLGDSFGVMAQYLLTQQLRIGYAFDLTTTQLGAYNSGTHEIMLSYDFRFAKGRTISPRYF
jgi:type IX secretion system PorP/SprF family membrane protein